MIMDLQTRRKIVLILSMAVLVIGTVTVVGYRRFPVALPPKQPIPFSHRVHAGVKQISCLMCHKDVLDSSLAGMPPVETCMLCHQRIIIHYPPIEELRQHWQQRRPIEWVQIYDLPELAHFPHDMHIKRGHDCSECHGDVQAMDRIRLNEPMTMGFCISCHRRENAPVDCFNCHY